MSNNLTIFLTLCLLVMAGEGLSQGQKGRGSGHLMSLVRLLFRVLIRR